MDENNKKIFEGFAKGEAPKVSMPPGMRAELEARAKALASEDPVCPECKVRMVLRISQGGAEAGAKFWGCRNYPKCRVTLAVKAGQ